MHYHIGAYHRDRLVNASEYTRSGERAEQWREQMSYAQTADHDLYLTDLYRRAVSDEFSEEFSDREPRDIYPLYEHRVISCDIAPSRCMATCETVASRRRSRA